MKLGMPQSIDYVRDIVEKADEDGNGTVSRREYLDAVAADLIPEGWNRSGRRVNSENMTYLLINT